MNLAILVAVTTTLFQLVTALVFLAVARAPGWERARLFSVMAASAAGYSAVNGLSAWGDPGEDLSVVLAVARYPFAGVHCCAWVAYAFADPKQPWRTLPAWGKSVIVATLVLSALMVVPGLSIIDQRTIVEVPWAGVVQHHRGNTLLGSGVAVWYWVVLLMPFARFVQHARVGEVWARRRVVAFCVFFGSGLVDVLVTAGVVELPYVADLGFLAVVLAVLLESVARFIGDAGRLQKLTAQLEEEVSHRTRERDEARDALTHAERLVSLGQLAAGVGHEINNPLLVLRANLGLLAETLARSPEIKTEQQTLVEESIAGVDRIARVVTDLRAYTLPAPEQREVVEVSSLVRASLSVASVTVKQVATVQLDIQDVAPVHADPVRLSQVLVNLLLNAAWAVREAHRTEPYILIRARQPDPSQVIIEVEDNGVGIAPEALARLCEPYYSSRLGQGGTGLGLFVAHGIVASLGGTLSFSSTVGVGTTARVTLPASDRDADVALDTTQRIVLAARDSDPSQLVPNAKPQPRLRVLVVDDDATVARSIARMLKDMDTAIAASANEALERLAQAPDTDLVLCDMMMPGKSGRDFHAELSRRMPELLPRVVFMTGGATIKEIAEFLAQDGVHHLDKPFDRRDLDEVLTALPSRAVA